MQCDMCGQDKPLLRVDIEGSELQVCIDCAHHGKVLGRVPTPSSQPDFSFHQSQQVPLELIIVPDYASIIRRKREALGMTQKDFAKLLNEKESFIHKMETGSFEPSLGQARKFERMLSIKLVEQAEEKQEKTKAEKSGPLTIGDLIKVKR